MDRAKLRPVSDIRLKPSKEVVELLDQMHGGGGFMGKNLAEVARIHLDMVKDRRCTKFLSFPAAPMATGLRGVFVDMVRQGMVDVIVHHLRDAGPRPRQSLGVILPWKLRPGRR